ncbi:RNA exonuclease Rex3 [Aspergillus heteromorphus CBS 117.55]|uniref:RNA exonuclease 3 n=1 Tax=Aspergillus heteromorphus CBS 117.55 TaxID=1448321 RepID=A0A317WZN5_9EURO|nr:RNA exonuclease Rex3 [Aspergillus heteromorphus CBS 117.55]PWY90188.1 RNA exonuclease Rex3 [Aspergillus heteromorphus CBS 117.55]
MFAPIGLFKDIPCPQGQSCSLLTCMFSHKGTSSSSDAPKVSSSDLVPTLNSEAASSKPIPAKPKAQVISEEGKSKVNSKPSPLPRKEAASQMHASAIPPSKRLQSNDRTPVRLQSLSREVTPPSKAISTPAKSGATTSQKRRPPRQAPRESLNPRMLTKAPAPHGVRLSILTKLHASMSAQNDKMAKDKDGPDRYLVLTPNELITMALDEEEKTAKENPSIYSNIVKLRIVKLSKLSKEDWAKEVKAHLNERYYKIGAEPEPPKPKAFTTGLSAKEEITLAKKLITPLEGLEEHGYVTKAPTDAEVESARKGVLESKGWEKCDRCGGRFQVFPGRREDGLLTTGGQCTYHPGKALYPPKKQTDHITGHREAYFSCCNESLGTSSGCTKGQTHVFKVSETKRLASILQFEKTPAQPGKGPLPPVCFDCEMGYTTLGLELIRLTAVSWPKGEALLDILVRPIGEVLDLNSRFSGVFPEHYTRAIPYGTADSQTNASTLEDGEVDSPPLQVVDSPATARALLFEYLQPDTPLIGHAIDNDLNASRIIHPTIIDTILLYPHPRGLPIRMGLKALTKRHLDRDIQTGGSRGHDSKEDAVATGDLVRFKAAETWKVLKSKDWRFVNGQLVPPPGTADAAADGKLGAGAGQKRTSSALGD